MSQRKRCTAKNRAGERCRNKAVIGSRVCRMHGGLSPKGPDAPAFKTGFWCRSEVAKMARLRLATRVRKGTVGGLEAAREEYAAAVEREAKLYELASRDPTLKEDRAFQHAATECRLAARHIAEAETALRDAEEEKARPDIHFHVHPDAQDAAGADAGVELGEASSTLPGRVR